MSCTQGWALVLVAAPLLGATVAQAEQAASTEPTMEEVVVVVGTRGAPRSAADSPVPVDAIDVEALESQASGDLTNLLRTTIPSYHVSTNPSRDAAALLRPVNLRGLAPDHTLVLVNNKRRHRGAVIQWISNGASDGAQGADISAIPTAAIKRVEVLRDGAAAQYGSDAIAGVVNFVLKDHADGASMEVKWGATTEDSDETSSVVSGNIGGPLGERGFLNVSAEWHEQDGTDRSAQHPDALAMQAVGVETANPAKPWGDPSIDGIKTFANMGYDLNDSARLYGFGNYASRDVATFFFYRSPQGRSGVYVSGGNILVGGGASCKESYGVPATPANIVAVTALLQDDDDCFGFVETLPSGFTPTFGGTMTDLSAVMGLAGSFANGIQYDLSVSRGKNEIEFFIHQTVNASYGPNTPRSFDIGAYVQRETNLNADFVMERDVGLASPLNVAAGFEWRDEEFEIVTGERMSWDTGPYGADGFSARSNGFGGFNPASSGIWSRANVAAYVDLEANVSDSLRLGGAVRFEDFDDFGTVENFKLTGHLRLTPAVALRGAVGTGFRAPTPGQQNANNLATVVDSATGVFREQGTVASTNPVAVALGGRALDAETATNYTLGLAMEFAGGAQLTIDVFRIEVQDRIALSDNLDVSDELRAQLLAAGVSAATDFNRVRYFTNDYDTATQGVDVVFTHGAEMFGGDTDVTFGFNHTQTEVENSAQGLSASRTLAIERGIPESRLSAAVNHERGSWRYLARYNFYGSWYDSDDGHEHDGYGMLDVAVRYGFDNGTSVAVGSDNVLDAYPDKAVRSPSSGRLYPRYSPAGYNGRLLYVRASHRF